MTSTLISDRTSWNTQTTGAPMAGTIATPPNLLMVPRCKITFEKCKGGVKIHCVCDDAVTAGMLQNLCAMHAGSLCSCSCILNGLTVCCCNFTMCHCSCEPTKDGVCITCTSGDKACCDMVQACCDAMACLCASGCTCCIMMNNTPVCCGC